MRLVFSLLAIAACGDNVKGIELDDLDVTRREAECERLTRCGLFTDEEACATYYRPIEDRNLREQVDRGLIEYNPHAASTCNKALARIGCSSTERDARTVPEPCAQTLVGQLPADATCVADRECGSGRCSEPTCTRSACCAGGCDADTAPGELGDACTADVGCVEDAYCASDMTCHALAALMEQCSGDSECAFGLGCVGATQFESGVCRKLPLLGEACPYLRCAEIGARCSPEQICVPAGTRGASCTRSSECSPYYACDTATSQCAELPVLGMPCAGLCAGESFCDSTSGQPVCIAPQPNGTPCTADNQCRTHYCEEGPIYDQCATPALCF